MHPRSLRFRKTLNGPAKRNPGEMNFTNHHPIHVLGGQSVVSTCPDTTFMTVLGSCVSACIYDPAGGIGGMNHFILADRRPPRRPGPPAALRRHRHAHAGRHGSQARRGPAPAQRKTLTGAAPAAAKVPMPVPRTSPSPSISCCRKASSSSIPASAATSPAG